MPKQSFSKKISGPLFLSVFYLAVSKFCFILLLTIVTSVVLMQGKDRSQMNQMINDISFQYMFVVYSVGAFFTLFVCWIGDRAFARDNPIWKPMGKLWDIDLESRKEFWRGVGSGALVPLVVIVLLQVSGQLNFLGNYVLSDTQSPIFFLFLLNGLALAGMVLCEEYIFRHKMLGTLIGRISPTKSVFLSSIGYVIVKHFQFSLALMDYVSLFLLSLISSYFYLRTNRIFRGMGFLGTIYGVVHFICGLNQWGHNTPGFFLFTDSKTAAAVVTGGNDGPLAGAAMISVLALVALASYWAWHQSAKENNPKSPR